jgi:hypothetical protein
LSVLGPHRFWHQTDGGVGEQQLLFDVHTPASAQVAEHMTVCPQLLVAIVLHLPAHTEALSGVQHVSLARQTSPGEPQVVPAAGPQGTSWPQLFLTDPQFLPAHVIVAGSGTHPQAPEVHISPASQPPQSTGLLQLSNCLPQRFAQ